LDQLDYAAESWATPNANERGPELDKSHREQAGGIDLQSQVVTFPSTHLTETTTELGELLQVWTRPECPRLNPAFQWWLMGWPSPIAIFSDSGAMEWLRWRRQLRLALRLIVSSMER